MSSRVPEDWRFKIGSRVKHLKTGHIYYVTGYGIIEATLENAYSYLAPDNRIWFRSQQQMEDGRFELISEPESRNYFENGCEVTPINDQSLEWKVLLENVQAELAEHLPSEDFDKIAKRPAFKAAMAAREGRPAKGPPRIILKYKKRFSGDDAVEVPFDTVEPINGKLVVTFSAFPKIGLTLYEERADK